MKSKVIHQVVREAKVRLFEGGGDVMLRLDPPHLGAVHMSVSANGGVVTASLQTDTETARRMLQADLPSLKQALADAGVNIDAINVSVGGSPNQGWNLQSGSGGGQSGAGRHMQSFGRMFGSETSPGLQDSIRDENTGLFDYLA